MGIQETLSTLQVDRAIWIDDEFAYTPEKLAQFLINKLPISVQCNFDVIHTYLELYDSDPEISRFEIVQYLTDIGPEKREELKQNFFAKETEIEGLATKELESHQFQYAIELLNIKTEDLWSFEDVESKLQEISDVDIAKTIFLVDLNNANGTSTEGLIALQKINDKKGCNFTFIVTHESATSGESQKEIELRRILTSKSPPLDLPICVIAKERLQVSSKEELVEPLKIALKRAGLHTSMHTTLNSLESHLSVGFKDAKARILEVPPEQLEKYVIEKAINEGVSELHVIERAITAQLSSKIRETFAMEAKIVSCNEKLRNLQKIKLVQDDSDQSHQNINLFRKLEVWESESLINKSFSPIACGDVFQVVINSSTKRYVLLAQPCDISLRGGTGKRLDSLGYFVELKIKDATENPGLVASCSAIKEKELVLPFRIDNNVYICDFRNSTPVNLNILDLASFNSEGIVHFHDNLPKPEYVMKGLQDAMSARFSEFKGYLTSLGAGTEPEPFGVYLAFNQDKGFNSIRKGKFLKSEVKSGVTLPNRIEWHLKRSGRIRIPFSNYILASYLNSIGRSAFDIDYTT